MATMPIHADLSHEALVGLPAPGEVLDGKYRLVRLIGAGGMGAVMEGVHVALHERVAVKFLLPSLTENEEALARFEREARALVQIKSEHVARVFDVSTGANSRPYMVMEYLEGRDLAEILAQQPRFDVREAVGHMLQSFEATAEAHALGIVHRDLKPENLFVAHRRDGTSCLKVLDFGLSKMIRLVTSQGQRPRALTMDDKTLGTPNYMSPEQWMSAKDVGPAADQWALAAILYELLAGRPAFGGKHVGEVCGKILNFEPIPLQSLRPQVPEALATAVHRALAKAPERRFPTLAEFAAAIASFGPPHGDLSVQRIAGVLGRPFGPTAPTALGLGVPHAGVPHARADSIAAEQADTLPSIDRPVEATDRWGSTPSWQKAASPLAEASRRKRRNLLIALSAGGAAVVLLLVVALSTGPHGVSGTDLAATASGDTALVDTARASEGAPSPSATDASRATDSSGGIDAVGPEGGAGSAPSDSTAEPSKSAARPTRTGKARPPPAPKPKSTSIFDQRW